MSGLFAIRDVGTLAWLAEKRVEGTPIVLFTSEKAAETWRDAWLSRYKGDATQLTLRILPVALATFSPGAPS